MSIKLVPPSSCAVNGADVVC